MIREMPLKYVVVYYVEADSYETLKAAVEYVARRLENSKVVYACGPYACFCRTEVEWSGNWLKVRSCTKQAVRAVAKWLIEAYTWLGGKEIQVVKYGEYTP
jgi:hypothetical protein